MLTFFFIENYESVASVEKKKSYTIILEKNDSHLRTSVCLETNQLYQITAFSE